MTCDILKNNKEMTHYDNSGSEDGQLRSPGDTHFFSGAQKNTARGHDELEDDDTDSLDIKPPQATIRRDGSTKHRPGKEKKHSKDHKHTREYRQRDERGERVDRHEGAVLNVIGDKYREREVIPEDQRYLKHYDRRRPISQIQPRREYHYERTMTGEDYEEQHNRYKTRDMYHYHQRYEYHSQRKYVEPSAGYEPQPNVEILEQDLRTRLLNKRHQYVKEYPTYNHHDNRSGHEYYREREIINKKKETIIEVMDSPERQEYYSNKPHKRKEKRRSPVDPELASRKAKLLEAEREMAKRKEAAKEELEARREIRREKEDVSGHNKNKTHLKRYRADKEGALKKKRKKKDKNKEVVIGEVISDESDRYTRSDSEVAADEFELGEIDSDTSSNQSTKKRKKHSGRKDPENFDICSPNGDVNSESDSSTSDSEAINTYNVASRKMRRKRKHINSDDDGILPEESPLSIGDLSKSPSKIISNNSSRSHTRSHSKGSSISGDEKRSVSRSRSRSRSKSGSQSQSQSSSGSSHSRYRSITNSRSRSPSPLRSRSKSLSRENETANTAEVVQKPIKETEEKEEDVPRNEKGEKLPNYFPGVQGCRSVEEFQCLNRIEEGTYGIVYRAKDKRTNQIVALKRLKMEKEKDGFPITSLREINTLLKGQHPNIVTVREIVVGSNMDRIFIVMDYVEHDLKSLMETMKHKQQSFLPGEVKCLVQQLLSAVNHLHDNWILHRDLKTSNLLLSHKGILKVGDFGLAREYGSPLKKYTSLVVTLWYRAPELLLCAPEYSTPIDIWSVGCIFAEFLQMQPLFPGKSEIDQLNRIFKELGTPNEKIWPGYKDLPAVKNLLSQNSQFSQYPVSNLRKKFAKRTTELGISLLQGLLTYDPKQRLTAEQALKHPFFNEFPLPIDPSMFPTWPAKSELGARKALASSPKPPPGGTQFKQLAQDDIIATKASGIISGSKKLSSSSNNTGFVLNAGLDQRQLAMGPGFNLKF